MPANEYKTGNLLREADVAVSANQQIAAAAILKFGELGTDPRLAFDLLLYEWGERRGPRTRRGV